MRPRPDQITARRRTCDRLGRFAAVLALIAALMTNVRPAASAAVGGALAMSTVNATSGFAAIDSDKDGKLDRAELTAAAGHDFERLDIDHDRYLTIDELKKAHAVDVLLPLPGRLEAASAFSAADTDHDQKIDKREYERAIVAAYMSCDANHDGTIEMSDLKHCSR
jgi:Ca2+-binding EF-hand superfamily protein